MCIRDSYEVARSEGLVLRYLSDAYRALTRTVPEEYRNDELSDLIEWLGELVRQIDSSLVDEWADLVAPTASDDEESLVPPAPASVVTNQRAFTVLVRNAMWRRVQLAAHERDAELEALDPEIGWPSVLDDYYDEYDAIEIDAAARSPQHCLSLIHI